MRTKKHTIQNFVVCAPPPDQRHAHVHTQIQIRKCARAHARIDAFEHIPHTIQTPLIFLPAELGWNVPFPWGRDPPLLSKYGARYEARSYQKLLEVKKTNELPLKRGDSHFLMRAT